MTLATFALVIVLVVVGAAAQRIAGLGFALLVSPFMTLLLGAHSGVLLVNVLGVISSLMILPRVRRSVDWSMFRWLSAFAVVGAVLGSWLSQQFSAAVMAVGVGIIVILALGASLMFSGNRFSTDLRTPRAVAGFVSGLTNSLAGVGGPAVSAYAVLTRWPQTAFAATLQPFFVLTGGVTIATKLLLDPVALPPTGWWFWGVVFVALVLGIFLGERLLRLVTPTQVRRFVILLAFAGAAASLVRGIVLLLA